MKPHVAAAVMVMVAAAAFKHVQAHCKEGTTSDNSCNTCTCFNSMVICTRRQCGRNPSSCSGTKGSYWMDNCHKCTCINKKPSCVLMPDCVTGKVKYQECEGKSSFLYECNTCRCGPNVIDICTQLLCPTEFHTHNIWL
ncbi:serine protease inhibitor I/II-like isoform X1 [Portunus trituberculatus]|uniref:serine protease inhibitor I/II-like isoform X1 n=1 Tax=Portunus trituberculatus TaxID=210409 RepID=UPI001E1CF65A|nr:serine protease inhibitor I/II-like isoform X1 [Portunus trituberculatus]